MLFASILSYSLWVPMNRINTHFLGKFISTISRYLFPQMLNTTRLFFRMLADAYCDFISFGLFQSAFVASRYQTINCCSLSGFSSQNSRNVLFAITLKVFFCHKYMKKLPNWEYCWFFFKLFV